MNAKYRVSSTSPYTAKIEDAELTPTHPTPNRRRIVWPTQVDDMHDKTKAIEITIMHQKKSRKSADCIDADSFNLGTLKAGQEIRLSLDASETYDLYQRLKDYYAFSEHGIPQGERTIVVTEDQRAAVLQERAQEILAAHRLYGDELWQVIESLDPQFLKAAAMHKAHLARVEAVRTFREHMDAADWSESDWQDFFENEVWIFGQNLGFQFLRPVEDQPHYGGTTMSGKGAQRGDMLMSTEADARFIVLA
jgi:hypothetical protein